MISSKLNKLPLSNHVLVAPTSLKAIVSVLKASIVRSMVFISDAFVGAPNVGDTNVGICKSGYNALAILFGSCLEYDYNPRFQTNHHYNIPQVF